MKIIVTGSCGFIGFHTCSRLLQDNHKVIGIDSMNDYYDPMLKQNNLKDLEVYKNFMFIHDDMGETDIISEEKPDIIIHLGGYAGVRRSLERPDTYIKNNIQATCHLLEESVRNGVKLFLFASSSSVYGLNDTPFRETDIIDKVNSIYAWTKKSVEELCSLYNRLYKLNCIGMRFFTVYGPRGRPDMAPLKFLDAISQKKKIYQYGDGTSERDYTYIDDIVDGIVGLMYHYRQGIKYEIFNLGNNQTTSLKEFIKMCEMVTGNTANIEVISNQQGDVPKTYANIDKAKRIIDYEPKIDVFQGLRRTYVWMQNIKQNKLSINGNGTKI